MLNLAMEISTIKEIDDLSNLFIALISIAAGARFIFLFLAMMENPDESGQIRKKMRNLVIFVVLSILVYSIRDVLVKYLF